MSAQAASPLAVKIVSDGQIRRFVLPGGTSREATAAAYDALRKLLSDNYAKAVAADYSLTFVDEEGDQCMLTNADEFREAVRLMAPAANATLKLFFQPKAGGKPAAAAAPAPAPVVAAAAPAPAAAKSTPAPALPPTPVAVAAKPKAAAPVVASPAPKPPADKPAADKPAASPAAAKPASPAAAKSASPVATPPTPSKPTTPAAKAPAAATATATTATATAAAPVSPSGSDLKHAVHTGVTCDGCGARPIVGARYKCSHAKCPDYDLCESCEEKGVHDATHVLLKIRAPRTREQKQAAELQHTIAAMVRANPWLAGQIEAVEVRTEAPKADDPTIVHTPLSGKVNVDTLLASVLPQVVAKNNALKDKAKEATTAAAAAKKDGKKEDVKAAPKPKAADAPKAAPVKADTKAADAKAPAAAAAGAVKPNVARQDRELASLREMGFTHDQMMLRALLVEARARTKSQRKKLGNVAYVAAKLTNN